MPDIFGKISIEPDNSDSTHKKKKIKSNTPPQKRQRPTKTSSTSTLIWLFFPIGLLLLYTVVGFWAVPYYITHNIPKQVSKNYNLTLNPGKVSFNPYTFSLHSELTTLTEPEGDPIISIPSLDLDFAPIPLLRMDLVCNRINITSPSINLVRHKDGSYNVSSLLPHLQKETDGSGIRGFSDLPFFFSLNNISITDGSVVFVDTPTKKKHNIHQLQLQLPTLANIAFKANNYIEPQFSAIVNGSVVSFKKSDPVPTSQPTSTTRLTWELKNIMVQDYVDYLPFTFPFSINKGIADGTLDLAFNNHDDLEDKLNFNFDLTIADIDVNTLQKRLELSSPLVKLSGSFVPVKKTFTVNSLTLDSPVFTTHSKDIAKDISSIFFTETNTSNEPIPITKPVALALHSLQFSKGTLKQVSGTGKNDHPQEWAELDFKVSNYVSGESHKPADNKPSVLSISGNLENGKNDFSYTATFDSPSVVIGDLSIEKMTSNELFSLILPNEKSIHSKGTAKLDARLTISKDSNNQQYHSLLSDVEATINNIEVSMKSRPIFSAKLLSFSGAQPHSSTPELGDVVVKNGTLHFNRKDKHPIFSKIESEQFVLHKLDYQGNITINSIKGNDHTFTLADATIQYSNKSTSESPENNLFFSAKANNEGKISAKGRVSLNPFKIDISTTFTKLHGDNTAALFPQRTFLAKTNGKLSGKGRFTFPQTSFTGQVTVSNGQFTRSDDQKISWDKFELKNVNYTSQPYHIGVGDISFKKPHITASINKDNDSIPTHFINLLRENLNNSGYPSSGNKKIFISPVDIQEISLTDGQVTITDPRLSPPWTGQITELNGVLKNIHSANSADNSTFNFSGLLDNSHFTWSGSIDPFKNTKTDRYDFELTTYPLAGLTKQTEDISDINSTSASINISSSSQWKDGVGLQSTHATISQLIAPSPNSESALPLALLTDKEGVIRLNIPEHSGPIHGNTSIFDVLISDLNKRIIKGNLSPLLLARGDFSDLIDNEFIDFKPGLFMLSDKGRKTLARYGDLLVTHPNIKLSLSGGVIFQIDKKHLHDQLEKNESMRVEKRNEKLFLKWQEKKKEYESQVTSRQSIAQENGTISESDMPAKVLAGFRPILPEPVVVDEEMLSELAEKRLEIVKQHITSQYPLAPGRVAIKENSKNTLSQNSQAKGVHVEIEPLF